MDRTEFGNLLDRIGQRIEESPPMEAEYWRGYFQGIKVYFRRGVITVLDHYHLHKIADGGQGDPYHVAYLRGYLDGCDGKMSLITLQGPDIPPACEEAAG